LYNNDKIAKIQKVNSVFVFSGKTLNINVTFKNKKTYSRKLVYKKHTFKTNLTFIEFKISK
jgi:hypothetical protein